MIQIKKLYYSNNSILDNTIDSIKLEKRSYAEFKKIISLFISSSDCHCI